MLSAEKVLSYDLDGSGKGDILIGKVKTDAAGVAVLIAALSVPAEPAIFMADATV